MKIKFSTLIIWAFFLVVLISCKKDVPTENPVPASTPNSSQLFVKFYEIDTTLAVPRDTVYRISLTYNSSNNPLTRAEFETKPNGDSSFYSLVKYEYAGTDSFAYRTTEYSKQFSSTPIISRDTTYYNFLNGKRVSDSLRSPSGITTNKYVYNTSYIKRTLTLANLNPSFLLNSAINIYQTKIGNNIINQIDTSVSNNSITPANTQYRKFTAAVSYLTNPNPFYKISFPIRREYLSDDLGISCNAAPQNLISQQNYSINSWTNNNLPSLVASSQINYTYTFRTDGLPIGGTLTRLSNGVIKKTKILFIYQ
jgi:hypothetical protein